MRVRRTWPVRSERRGHLLELLAVRGGEEDMIKEKVSLMNYTIIFRYNYSITMKGPKVKLCMYTRHCTGSPSLPNSNFSIIIRA